VRNLFESAQVEEVKQRLLQLRPDSRRQWGRMNPAQALAHCSAGLEMALGQIRPPRLMIGRVMGRVAKAVALRNEAPIPRNVQTAKELVVADDRDFQAERSRLSGMIDRFAAAGPVDCTTHPHFFFGHLTPGEWAVLMYKHLDHHLRQFGV